MTRPAQIGTRTLHPDRDVGDAELARDLRHQAPPELGSDRSKNGPVGWSCKVAMEQPDAVLPGALAAARRDWAVPVGQSPVEDRDQAGRFPCSTFEKDREPRVPVETLGDLRYFLHEVLVGVGEIDATRNRLEQASSFGVSHEKY